MKQENRNLLLMDLCARLPYGVYAKGSYLEEASYENPFPKMKTIEGLVEGVDHIGFDNGEVYVTIEGIPCELGTVKLYLKKIEDMPEDVKQNSYWLTLVKTPDGKWFAMTPETVEWLQKNHYDYHSLIGKRVALKAKEGMY